MMTSTFIPRVMRRSIVVAICLLQFAALAAAQKPAAPGKPIPQTPPPSEQSKPAPPPSPSPPKSHGVHVRLSGNVGFTAFKATDSFKAVLGTNRGVTFGGGAGVLLGDKLFVDVDVDRFSHTGERVFIGADKALFHLGIPLKVTTTPIDATVGWRAHMVGDDTSDRRPSNFIVTTFVGAGVGVLKYEEKSDFAEAGDNVNKTFTSYHIMGGAEFPVGAGFGVIADIRYRWVPNALGDAGVSAAYNEKDLGGFALRVKGTFTF